MRPGRASITATIVGAGRGIGVRPGTNDPTAAILLPWPARKVVRLTRRRGPSARALRGLARVLSFGMVDHVCLRTAAIDAALTRAIREGCRQLVVLGAGLDGRAWRLESLREVDVFEVDHPDTQADKRRRVEALELRSASISFVAVDFARDRLTDALAAARHDCKDRTFWIWEGVTPYLPQPAIAATLADIASCSASGSTLAMTYVVPGLVMLEGSAARAVARVTQAAFRVLGEPLLGATEPAWVAERLEGLGFDVEWDDDARGWTQHGPGNPTLSYPFRAERLVIATRG